MGIPITQLLPEIQLTVNSDPTKYDPNGNGQIDDGSELSTLLSEYKITKPEYLTNEYSKEVLEIAEIAIKYEGYIQKTYREVEKMLKLESKKIPVDIDYDKISNLASEARQKLKTIRPETVSQASALMRSMGATNL